MQENRSVRIFLSSTFRDFGEERDLLVRQVFPALRARLKERFVELVDVDLRWGITAEQAERGEVLPICLVEIDRARPFFIGMLGERYGWVPPPDAYAPDLVDQQKWLRRHQGGASVTELEIRHGVLNNPRMAGRAFFYFRAASYARKKGGAYLAASSDDAKRQADLKERIRQSGFPVVRYRDPESLARRIGRDLWKVLDEAFPADRIPDAFEREGRAHQVHAASRRSLYLGGDAHARALDAALRGPRPWVLVEGEPGGGKTALLAHWLASHQRAHRQDRVHAHYLGASADAGDPVAMVRRLILAIQRETGRSDALPSNPQRLYASLPAWLAQASEHARRRKCRWILVLDGLDRLADPADLRWLPQFLPPRVHLVVSCRPGTMREALLPSAPWKVVRVRALGPAQRRQLLAAYLGRYNKTLPRRLESMVLRHPLAGHPLFLRTVAEELRLLGVHEALEAQLRHYLESRSTGELFGRVLERLEHDCGRQAVKASLCAIWASRAGLTDGEIGAIARLVPATWAPIRRALDEAITDSSGRLDFAHDALRDAVERRYLASQAQQTAIHRALARWFATRPADNRRAEEEPHQWKQAGAWKQLHACVSARDMFLALTTHRPLGELQGYWLALGQALKLRAATTYARRLPGWRVQRAEGEDDDGALQARLFSFLSFAGEYGDFTRRLAREALERVAARRGEADPLTQTRRNDLGWILQLQGRLDEAHACFSLNLAQARAARPRDAARVGRSLVNLGLLRKRQGDLDGAMQAYEEGIGHLEKALTGEHEDVARALANLAALHAQRQQIEPAAQRYAQAIRLLARARGAQHPDVGVVRGNFAAALLQAGRWDEAIAILQETCTQLQQSLGPQHPDTGFALGNLGAGYLYKGQLEQARACMAQALEVKQRQFGDAHDETIVEMNNLGAVLIRLGRFKPAEALLARALDAAQGLWGEASPRLQPLVTKLEKARSALASPQPAPG